MSFDQVGRTFSIASMDIKKLVLKTTTVHNRWQIFISINKSLHLTLYLHKAFIGVLIENGSKRVKNSCDIFDPFPITIFKY